MNIAIIGYMGWYGSIVEWACDGFQMNGHAVAKYDRKDMANMRKDHDVYLFFDCSEDFSSEIPEIDKPKVFWSLDSHMPGGLERSTNIARKCDLTIVSNDEWGKWILDKFGINTYLVPVTYNDRWVNSSKQLKDREYDVVMIGNPNSEKRLQLWEMLSKRYKCFLGKANTLEEYKHYMSEAKIVVNQPTEPWDIILNNRFFEALGYRSLLLQKVLKTKLIQKLGFRSTIGDDKDFIYWSYWHSSREVRNLPKSIDHYLKNIDYAQEVADRGNAKVQKYAMSKQCKKVEQIILEYFKL